MDEDTLKSLVEYRLSRAFDTLDEAQIMASHQRYTRAISLLYYSCYYAVLALLIKYGITAKNHEGVKQMMGWHFVKTGEISMTYSKLYSELLAARISGDYDDFFGYDSDDYKKYCSFATDFINSIKEKCIN